MQDDVCVVLNEHESQKAEMALALADALSERGLSCTRLEASEQLLSILQERAPRVLVLDYLIGNVSTALDLLPELQDCPETQETSVVLWTDEPSTAVAVSAMKLGAVDFISFGTGDDLGRLISVIEEEIKPANRRARISANKVSAQTPSQPVGDSESFRETIRVARSVAARNVPCVVLCGPMGVGRSTIARFIHQQRSRAGQYFEIECDTWVGTPADIFGSQVKRSRVPLLSYGATVVLEHADFEGGDILAYAENHLPRSAGTETDYHTLLIVGCSDSQTAASWSRLVDAEVITIEPLASRSADVWPLVQYFQSECKSLGHKGLPTLSASVIERLNSLPWPGNTKELRATLFETMTAPLSTLPAPDTDLFAGLSDEEKAFLVTVQQASMRWQRYHGAPEHRPAPLTARLTLEHSQGNERIAAARLGTTIATLREILTPGETSAEEQV